MMQALFMTFCSPSDLYLNLAFCALGQSRGCRNKNAVYTGEDAAPQDLLCLLNETEAHIWDETWTLEIS